MDYFVVNDGNVCTKWAQNGQNVFLGITCVSKIQEVSITALFYNGNTHRNKKFFLLLYSSVI